MKKLSPREINARIYRYSVQINQYFKDTISEIMEMTAKGLNIQAGVRFSHYFILCELFHSESPMYLTTISQLVGVKLPNVSKLVNELIDCGLVERCVSQENKRIVLVQLTKLGREYSERLIPEISKVHASTFGPLDQSESVYRYYQNIHDRLFGSEND